MEVPNNPDSAVTMAEVERAWKATLKKELAGKEPPQRDLASDYPNSEPTLMQRAYHPKNNSHMLPEMLPEANAADYPAKRPPAEQVKHNANRIDPHRFAECRFSPSKGLVLNVRTTSMPFVIIEKKTVTLDVGAKGRGDVQHVKHLKLKPLAPLSTLEDEDAPAELRAGEWVLSTNCAPIELHFDYYFGKFAEHPEMRAVYLDALVRQKAFYPELTPEQLYHKLRPQAEVPAELAAAIPVT